MLVKMWPLEDNSVSYKCLWGIIDTRKWKNDQVFKAAVSQVCYLSVLYSSAATQDLPIKTVLYKNRSNLLQ